MQKFPQIQGFGDEDEWSLTDVERYRDDLVRRRILDVQSELDDECPACGTYGWMKNTPPSCKQCLFGATSATFESAVEVRKRAFVHRVAMLEPLRRDPFSEFSSIVLGHSLDRVDPRIDALCAIGLSYKKSRQLLRNLRINENIQASHMLCIALGAIAMHKVGADDADWLINETARRIGDERFIRFIQQPDVLLGLQNFYRDVRDAARTGNMGAACHLCQFAIVHHFQKPGDAALHQEKIVASVAEMVAHVTVVSSLRAGSGPVSRPKVSAGGRPGCAALLVGLGVAWCTLQ